MKAKTRRMLRKKSVTVLASVMCVTLAFGLGTAYNGTSTFAETSSKNIYNADYSSMEEVLDAGAKLNIELAEEGSVLLKNDGALPFDKGVKNISLFGMGSYSFILGGGGSGSGSGEYNTVKESLEAAGYTINPLLWKYYSTAEENAEILSEAGIGHGAEKYEPETSNLNLYTSTYSLYNDAALIFIRRTGMEAWDRPTSDVPGHSDSTEHYLELNDNEKELIQHVEQYFDKIVVIINSSNVMELNVFEDDPKINSVLWVGNTGNTGIMALGEILSGEVNPSGKTVDIYPSDLKQDPTWKNYSYNSQNNTEDVSYDNYVRVPADSDLVVDGSQIDYLTADAEMMATGYFTSVEYREGIYVGYRWYETAATVDGYYQVTENNMPNNEFATYDTTDPYYNRTNGVVYPFGYGLSYTTFEYSNYSVRIPDNKDGTVYVTITVTNTGKYAGKDVVEVYSTPEYFAGGIEKAEANLVDFAKTKLLQPGQSQTITMDFTLQDLASFDYNDANNNNFYGYELEGNITLSVRSDSHNVLVDTNGDNCSTTFTVNNGEEGNGYTFPVDQYSGNAITTLFSNGDRYDSLGQGSANYADEDGYLVNIEEYITRDNFHLPATATVEDNTWPEELIIEMRDEMMWYAYMEDGTEPWAKTMDDIGDDWTQAASTDSAVTVYAAELAGLDYDDPLWTQFINQFTIDEMKLFIGLGGSGTIEMERLGLPAIYHDDGPGQFASGGRSGGEAGTFWVSEVVIASTWNVELAEKQGQIIGNESLFNNTTGWWGSAFNTHRSAFAGRNFEYYSSDGVQGGKIGAAVIRGAGSKGVQTFIKHFVLNDQETDRYTSGGICTWVSEQAMREIYLKSFEIAFKEGGSNAVMTAFNRVGRSQSASNYTLIEGLLRNEWGLDVTVITDAYGPRFYNYPDLFIRAGNSLALAMGSTYAPALLSGEWNEEENMVYITDADGNSYPSPTQWYWLRNAIHRCLYIAVNSNGMDNYYDLSSFQGTNIGQTNSDICVQGLSFNHSVAGSINEEVVTYRLIDGVLPEGLTLEEDGTISGKALETGTFEFTVEVVVNYWVTKTQNFTLTVSDAMEYDIGSGTSLDNAVVGKDIDGVFGSDYFKLISDGGIYNSIEFSVSGNIPKGVSFTSNGELYGAPEETGTYNFTVTIEATRSETDEDGQISQITDTVSREFTIIVGEGEVVKPVITLNLNYDGAVNSAATLNDDGTVAIPATPVREGYEFTGWYLDSDCTIMASFQTPITADVTYYAGWTKVASEAVQTGCSGSIQSTMTIVGGLAIIAVAFITVRVIRKRTGRK